jgi:SAM-dependent methyltransferase
MGKLAKRKQQTRKMEVQDLGEPYFDFGWGEDFGFLEPVGGIGQSQVSGVEWDLAYREGTPVWETGQPAEELVRLIEQKKVPRGTVLDIGCGTGANAVFLAERGFDVTAVDISPTAVERARTRASLAGVNIHFVVDDVFQFIRSNPAPYDFLLDAGLYPYIRAHALNAYLDLMWKASRPGSYCLVLAGHAAETAEGAPPGVNEDDLRLELGRLFEFLELRPIRMASPFRPEGFLGWSCFLYRPIPPGFRGKG